MSITEKINGKAMSFPCAMAISGAISIGITLIGSILISNMLLLDRLSWEEAGYWILAMLFLSALLGTKGAISAFKHQRMVISFMSGLVYWGLLLCITALFFGGNYDAVPETAGVIIAGSGCAAMISTPERKKKTHKTRKS